MIVSSVIFLYFRSRIRDLRRIFHELFICSRLHDSLKESIEQFRLHLLERDELTPLKVWQVQELSYQAAQRIVEAGQQKALNIMVDSSQNFPLAARSLSRQIVRKEFMSEVVSNDFHLYGKCSSCVEDFPFVSVIEKKKKNYADEKDHCF